MRAPTLMILLLASAPTTAAPGAPTHELRVACVAPEGSAWAHELHAFAREIETATSGEVRIKLYLGGIAGGEQEVLDRIKRNQLDGAISGGMMCSRLGPSLRVLRVIGLLRDRAEAIAVVGRLKPTIDEEFRSHGFQHLGGALVGMDMLFSRQPLKSLDDLRKTKFWIWDLDDVVQKQLTQMGIPFVPSSLPDAAALFNSNKVDGFFTVPGAALAFQWSAQVKYVGAFDLTALAGCAFVTASAYDALPNEAKLSLQSATAKLQVRFNDTTQTQDAQLLERLYARQGVTRLSISPAFADELARAADAAVRKAGDQLVPPALLARARQIIAEFRASHH